jgi:glucan biosynthesis protein C
MARATGFWEALYRSRWIALLLAASSYGFIIWYFYASGYDDANLPPDALRAVQRAVWGVNQWCSIAAIFGFAYRFRHADSAALRYLVPAVFPVYILHQTVIVTAAYNLQPLSIPSLPEGLLLVALTLTACFAGYEIVRRIRWLRPLFGLKLEANTPKAAQASAVAES